MLDFEGRGGEELAIEISNFLKITYSSPFSFDLKSLCILPKHQCWKLYVDILILQCAGNLYDAISLAVKCALYNLRIPRVNSAILDGGNVDLVLSDDLSDCDRLNVESVPVLITTCKIGDHCIVDPSIEEEICSSSSAVIGVSNGKITTLRTISGDSFHPDTLDKCIELAVGAAQSISEKLLASLKQEEKQMEKSKNISCPFLN